MTFSVDPEVGAVLAAASESDGPPPMPPVGDHPGVPHEYDAIAVSSDVAHRAQADRDRTLRSL